MRTSGQETLPPIRTPVNLPIEFAPNAACCAVLCLHGFLRQPEHL